MRASQGVGSSVHLDSHVSAVVEHAKYKSSWPLWTCLQGIILQLQIRGLILAA